METVPPGDPLESQEKKGSCEVGVRGTSVSRVGWRTMTNLKTQSAKGLGRASFNMWGIRSGRQCLRVVTYHHLCERPCEFVDELGVAIPPDLFEAHLRVFSRDYDVVDLAAVLSGELPKRPLLITFDDGYRSVVDIAATLLSEYGMPAVSFIPSDCLCDNRLFIDNFLCYLTHRVGLEKLEMAIFGVNGRTRSLQDLIATKVAWLPYAQRATLAGRLAEEFGVDQRTLREQSNLYLKPSDAAKLHSCGIEIGNHTQSHVHCRVLNGLQAEVELVGAKRKLESWCGRSMRAFSFPYGTPLDNTETARRVLKQSGHSALFLSGGRANCSRSVDSIWDRISLSGRNGTHLFLHLEMLPRLRSMCDRVIVTLRGSRRCGHPLTVKKGGGQDIARRPGFERDWGDGRTFRRSPNQASPPKPRQPGPGFHGVNTATTPTQGLVRGRMPDRGPLRDQTLVNHSYSQTAGTNVSILIVSFNTRRLTLECLCSVYAETTGITFEVIVVDNASNDGSADAIAERYPQAELVRSKENLGFAGGNNLAAERATGEYLLLLNPDTVVLSGAIQELVTFAKMQSNAGIYGGRTFHADGTLNPASCWRRATIWSIFCRGVGLSSIFRRSSVFDSETYGRWPRDTVREVDLISGCFFLIEKGLWDRLGGFDTRFFMYCEEADLCLRARALGARCLICPDAQIIHYGGASEKDRSDKLVKSFRAKAHLVHKHWRKVDALFAILMLDFWALSRTAIHGMLRPINRASGEAYVEWRQVWRRRAEWHGYDE